MWILNAKVVDVVNGTVSGEGAVRVDAGRIAEVLADPSRRPGASGEPRDEAVIDLEGAYLCPGLISCHTHLSIVFPFNETDEQEHPGATTLRAAKRANDALQAGVTTIRTTHDAYRVDILLREQIARGWATGPRIVAAGRGIDTTGGHGSGQGCSIADGAAEFLKAARAEIAAGANHIKVFLSGGIAGRAEEFGETQVSPEELEAAVCAARSHSTYVTAHAGDSGPIRTGLAAGVRCYEHGYRLDAETCRLMREADAWLVPTLVVSRSADWMREHRLEEWTIQKSQDAAPAHMEAIRLAVAAGVNIANGTDMPPGDFVDGTTAVVREAEHLVAAGMSPADSLRASTRDAARLCQIETEVGSIEPGLAADFVATPKNPLEDISALRDIFLVIQDGRVVRDDRKGN